MKKILFIIIALLLIVQPNFGAKKDKHSKKKVTQNIQLFDSEAQYRSNANTLIEAVCERIAGNIVQAQSTLQKLISDNPKYDLAHFEYAKILLMQNKTTEAISELTIAINLNDSNDWFKVLLAECYDKISQYDKSETLWKILAEHHSDNVEYFYKYALSLIYQNKLKEAVVAYNKIESLMGVNEDISNAKRNIWIHLNKIDKAVEEMEKLAAAYPTEAQYQINIADFYISKNLPEKALPYLKKAYNINPNNAHINVSLYNYYVSSKNDEKAGEYLKRAFESPELNIDEKIRILMRYYNDKQNKDFAFELIDKLIIAHPNDAKTWSIYADFLNINNRLKEAKEAFEKVHSIDNSKYATWQQYLSILLQLGLYNEAYQQSETAISLFPTQPAPYMARGISAIAIGEPESALPSLQEGLSFTANSEQIAEFNFFIGKSYAYLDKIDSAFLFYDVAVRKSPKNAMYLNEYSYELAEKETNLQFALELAKQANELEKNNPYYLDTYAWILYKQKDYINAKIWIEKAINCGGNNDIEIMEHYAHILEQLGENNLLKDCYQHINYLKSQQYEK